MSRFKSVLNLSFGDWTVIDETEIGSNRRVKCRCKCGREDMVFVNGLRRGSSTCCKSCAIFESVLGREFGKLTVTAEPERGWHRKVLCSCDCGRKDFLTYLVSLQSGCTKSCGCMKYSEFYESGIIYYLLDLINKVHYVGQTVQDPQRRLSYHINNHKTNKKKCDWIFSLLPYKPQILVAEANIPLAQLTERENFHINLCLRRKQPLLNIMLPA